MKTLATVLAALILAMPFAMAQQASANAQAISTTDLRFRQIGEGFNDFFFEIKALLTFDESTKIDLIKERNAQLKARQQQWLELKSSIESSTKAERKEMIAIVQAEHEAIIRKHIQLTEEIKKIQLKAKARGDADLELKAELAEDADESLSSGLSISGASMPSVEAKIVTAADAESKVENNFGFASDSVTVETKNGAKFYVVAGEETETAGSYTLTKAYTVWVSADTGVMTSVDLNTHIEAESQAETSSSGSTETNTEALVSSDSNAEIDVSIG